MKQEHCVLCGQSIQIVDMCDYEACPYCDLCVDSMLVHEKELDDG